MALVSLGSEGSTYGGISDDFSRHKWLESAVSQQGEEEPLSSVDQEDGGPRQSTLRARQQMKNRLVRRCGGRVLSRRLPSGRASILVFVLAVAERFVFFGAVSGVLDLIPGLTMKSRGEFSSFLKIFLYYCVGRVFYPIGGFLADVYLGRYRVIHLSLWLYWIAFVLLEVAHLLQLSSKASVIYGQVVPILSYVLIVLASGGFQSTLIPFGADQIEGGSSSELSSYFYWLYFANQVGILCSVLVSSAISSLLPGTYVPIIQVLVALVVLTSVLILHKYLKKWYFRNILRENCIKTVLQVLWYAARVKRHMPKYRRAFRYGEGIIPHIELAKIKYDGIFTEDHVEDVKSFCRICLILFSLGGFFFSLSGWTTALIDQMNTTLTAVVHPHSQVSQAFTPNIYAFLNTLSLMVFLPLVNHLLVPCVPSLTIRGKIAIGFVITILSLSLILVLEFTLSKQSALQRFLWYAVPSILLTLPEVLVLVSALEFVYAQSPESMRGMLTGLLYFILGIFSGGSSATFYLSPQASSRYSIFYAILLAFIAVWFVKYIIVACLYVNHQRPNRECDENEEIRHVYNIAIR